MHELPDGGENGGDLLVVLGELLVEARLELRESPGELAVGAQQLAQLHEGAHDIDTHLHRTGAVEDGGGHDRAVLGKGIGKIPPTPRPWAAGAFEVSE
jgi:hypothetical protein